MHSTNYFSTLIVVSPDTSAEQAIVPPRPGTVAALQHEILVDAPHSMTSDDLYVAVEAARKQIPKANWPALRQAIFVKPQACMRASPLVRSYGWGVHHDAQGRIALIAVDSDDYARLTEDPEITVVAGMRSKRA